MIEAEEAGVAYEIQKGKDILIEPEDLYLNTIEDEVIYITEVPNGAKAGLKIIAGFILIVVGVFTAQPWLIAMGASLAVGGIVELLVKGPETEATEDPSYFFNGPSNNISQNIPVPVLYGELIIGGKPMSGYYQATPIRIPSGEVIGTGSQGSSSPASSGNNPINLAGGESTGVSSLQSFNSTTSSYWLPTFPTTPIIDDYFIININDA